MKRVILVRYGEIGLKGRNRPIFEKTLEKRLRRVLEDLPGTEVKRKHGRLVVRTDGSEAEACRRLARVFGVVSFSPSLELPLDLEALASGARTAVREFLSRREEGVEGTVSFKVKARRANKSFPLDSMELNRYLGAHLLETLPGLKVDVHEPELTVTADIRDVAYIHASTFPGPGGLPTGASGKAHLLLSGGIDSPVAGWMVMKRGVVLEAVHFHSPPFTSERSREKVVDLCRRLALWGGPVTLHVVRFTEAQKEIHDRCPAELGITIMRRMMLRIAGRIARDRGGLALVTGESLGQVASQTLESMNTISMVADLPVLRPLVGMDKAEIVERARHINTFDISVRPYEDCCTIFIPKNPRTKPRPEEAADAEAALVVDALVEGALARVETEVVKA